jgi:hypothetical protein
VVLPHHLVPFLRSVFSVECLCHFCSLNRIIIILLFAPKRQQNQKQIVCSIKGL